ncbi:MAG: lipoate--protein ligase [Clostridia bacterium]|nr:lipoate--protein ligase [Clostridia bacterium]
MEKVSLRIIDTTSVDPWHNLALEEKLFFEVEDNEAIFYLWQNQNTVVIGRNQNPYRECKYLQLEQDGGKLARRLSGGGAVFHDLGNLNFTFIMKKPLYDIKRQLQVIIDAMANLGIKAEFSGRNDILTDGRKFSGNAFYYHEDRCYHHGTLLVSADILNLAKYLSVSKKKIESKGVKSVQSRVINLSELKPDLTIDKLKDALKDSFMKTYSHYDCQTELLDEISNETLYNKYASWDWRFGKTPEFRITLYERFTFGDFEIMINLKDSYISEIKIFSDAMDVDLVKDLENALINKKYSGLHLADEIGALNAQYGSIILDLQNWLRTLE